MPLQNSGSDRSVRSRSGRGHGPTTCLHSPARPPLGQVPTVQDILGEFPLYVHQIQIHVHVFVTGRQKFQSNGAHKVATRQTFWNHNHFGQLCCFCYM